MKKQFRMQSVSKKMYLTEAIIDEQKGILVDSIESR